MPEAPPMPQKDQHGRDLGLSSPPEINLLDDIEGSKPNEFYTLCIPPTDGRFYYPSEKRRNRDNHEAMRSAEQQLDAFWSRIDANLEIKRQWHTEHFKQCEDCCDCGVDSALRKFLMQPHYLQRLGLWVKPSPTAQE